MGLIKTEEEKCEYIGMFYTQATICYGKGDDLKNFPKTTTPGVKFSTFFWGNP